ncbi:DUF6807 family protein [Botrimarina sp.]|uniref:DUF6807 family protein n=1 Tax=Botrimarina sp. TaxID=2795802 RepID=UPI0032EA94CA
MLVSLEGQPVVEYAFADEAIPRPYFASLRTPAGVQVTRNHPPVAGEDRMDHPDYHPGVWLAFGDLSGADNWRLEASVEHVRFIQEPTVGAEAGSVVWAVENRYSDSTGETICRSVARHTVRLAPEGVLVTYDVTFFGDSAFAFGDQEEMGLGVRVATPLRVEEGGPDPAPPGAGQIVADGGRRGSAEVWGKPADWVDYRGELHGEPAGLAIFCHPGNFRPSRMHARDYGFICANPFSLAAFDAGESLRTTVKPGESLRLRYAVLAHGGERLTDERLESAWRAYAEDCP